MKSGPEIRNDDVLQMIDSTTYNQRKDLDGRTLFEAFLEADAVFEKYNYPCTLAVLSEGIQREPHWVKHIRANMHRYKIELHGRRHFNYKALKRAELFVQLGKAKIQIEQIFGVEITTWYPPFGRKGENLWGIEVCKELGMEQYRQVGKVDAKFWLKDPEKYPHVNFHYWNRPQVRTVEKILKQIHESN